MSQPLIAGVGFATIGEQPDLSGLDRALGRIEDAGASHAELALVRGRSDRRRTDPARAATAARGDLRPAAPALHGPRRARRQLHGRGQPRPAQGGMSGQSELAASVGASVLVHHPGVIPARPARRIGAAARGRARRLAGDGRPGRPLRPEARGRDPVRRERCPSTRPTRSGSPPNRARSAIRTSSARSTSATAT